MAEAGYRNDKYNSKTAPVVAMYAIGAREVSDVPLRDANIPDRLGSGAMKIRSGFCAVVSDPYPVDPWDPF